MATDIRAFKDICRYNTGRNMMDSGGYRNFYCRRSSRQSDSYQPWSKYNSCFFCKYSTSLLFV